MLLSIAIPTYNNIKTIELAINSCLQQSFPDDFEVVIVDNHSDDGSSELLNKIAGDNSRIKLFRNENTVSLFENHNICLKHAQGKYVLFCHSDDRLEPDALTLVSQRLEERGYPSKYVLWGSSLFRDFYKSMHYAKNPLNTILAGERAYIPFFYGGLTPSGTCYSRDSLLRYGGFLPTNYRLTPSDMSTMLYLASQRFEFEMMDRILFDRKYSSTATVNRLSTKEYWDAFDDAIGILIDKIGKGKFTSIARNSLWLESPPVEFWFCLAKRRYYKKELIKNLIKHPLLLNLLNKNNRIFLKTILL
ncbi:MAG: glycosyltransferase family 2 protein [Sporomusaceae bacterium]|nr:glycosyltransferase family 2 protein [Sporomusaceae bacterium]